MVQQRKPMRNLLGILKDKTSLIKIVLSIKRPGSSSIHVAVLRATAHTSSASPPPDHHVDAILSLGHDSRPAACACVAAIMDRLHGTQDVYVALRCLFTLHQIIYRGSVVIKEQLSFYPSAGGRNFLNLSTFRDDGDADTWELSSWVRWYASVLERNLEATRILGTFVSSSTTKIETHNKNRVNSEPELNSDLMRQTDALVTMVEEISRAPDSLHFQQHDLIYEIVNSVGEDYRSTQHRTRVRVSEFSNRIDGLSLNDSTELMSCLKRLEDCRERLMVLFVNRKRNDAFWDLVRETKMKVVELEEERGRKGWLVRREKSGELTRVGERVAGPAEVLRLTNGSQWLDFDRGQLTVRPAMA